MADQPRSTPADRADVAWDEAFVVELRLLGVTGDRIGAALAEVEAHCADSGETRPDAFGAPAPYARALQLPSTAIKGPDAVTIASVVASWTGVAVWFKVADAWRQGHVDVTAGALAALALVFTLGTLLVVLRGPAEDAVVRHPVLVPALSVGVIAGSVTWLAGTWDTVVTSPDWRVLAVLGTLLLLADLVRSLRSAPRADPVVAPAGSRPGAPPLTIRGDRLLRSATPWVPITVASVFAALGFWR